MDVLDGGRVHELSGDRVTVRWTFGVLSVLKGRCWSS